MMRSSTFEKKELFNRKETFENDSVDDKASEKFNILSKGGINLIIKKKPERILTN